MLKGNNQYIPIGRLSLTDLKTEEGRAAVANVEGGWAYLSSSHHQLTAPDPQTAEAYFFDSAYLLALPCFTRWRRGEQDLFALFDAMSRASIVWDNIDFQQALQREHFLALLMAANYWVVRQDYDEALRYATIAARKELTPGYILLAKIHFLKAQALSASDEQQPRNQNQQGMIAMMSAIALTDKSAIALRNAKITLDDKFLTKLATLCESTEFQPTAKETAFIDAQVAANVDAAEPAAGYRVGFAFG